MVRFCSKKFGKIKNLLRFTRTCLISLNLYPQQAERKSKELIHFADDTRVLEEAAKASVEQLTNEIKTLDLRIGVLKKEIQLPGTQGDIKGQMGDFLQVSAATLRFKKKFY